MRLHMFTNVLQLLTRSTLKSITTCQGNTSQYRYVILTDILTLIDILMKRLDPVSK